jgi:regulatory protein
VTIRRIPPERGESEDPGPAEDVPRRRAGGRKRPRNVREAALRLLARRDFNRCELERRLESQRFRPEEIAGLVGELTASRALDDVRFAHNYVSYHAARGQGPLRIRADLETLGVEAVLIEAALAEGQDWLALAREQCRRRFGPEVPAGRREQLRQARFLQSRGFSSDHIRSALGVDFDAD